MTNEEIDQLANEFAIALAPIAADVFAGKAKEETLYDAQRLVLTIIAKHLLISNAAVLLADLKAVAAVPGRILTWLNEHAGDPNKDPLEQYHTGP